VLISVDFPIPVSPERNRGTASQVHMMPEKKYNHKFLKWFQKSKYFKG
jgi:hypothetical protein